jgi:hypothetical protein
LAAILRLFHFNILGLKIFLSPSKAVDAPIKCRQHPTIELDTQNTNLSNNFCSRDGINPLLPRRAPEGLGGSARRGDAGMHRVFGGLWIDLPKTPFKPFGAQDQSVMGWHFLWILSFGQTKESISAVGPRPDIKTSELHF